jgi:hypothetical protein
MAYRVELTKNAEAELEELYLWVIERAPTQGAAWFNGLERAILSSSNSQADFESRLKASTATNRFAS